MGSVMLLTSCVTKRRSSEICFGGETASISSPLLYSLNVYAFDPLWGDVHPLSLPLSLSHPKRLCYQKDSAATQMILRKAIRSPTRISLNLNLSRPLP